MKTNAMSDDHQNEVTSRIDGVLAYSIDQFCRASSLGRSYVYEQIAAGALRTVKRGKRRLILSDDAHRFLRGESPASAA